MKKNLDILLVSITKTTSSKKDGTIFYKWLKENIDIYDKITIDLVNTLEISWEFLDASIGLLDKNNNYIEPSPINKIYYKNPPMDNDVANVIVNRLFYYDKKRKKMFRKIQNNQKMA